MSDRYLLDKSAGYRTHVPAVRARLTPLMERGLLARCGLTDLESGVSARSREDHYDRDFDRIAGITGQPVEWVVAAGSI